MWSREALAALENRIRLRPPPAASVKRRMLAWQTGSGRSRRTARSDQVWPPSVLQASVRPPATGLRVVMQTRPSPVSTAWHSLLP